MADFRIVAGSGACKLSAVLLELVESVAATSVVERTQKVGARKHPAAETRVRRQRRSLKQSAPTPLVSNDVCESQWSQWSSRVISTSYGWWSGASDSCSAVVGAVQFATTIAAETSEALAKC